MINAYGQVITDASQGVSLARTVSSSIGSTTEITLNAKTTFIRVYASSKDVFLKWGIDDASAVNFDEIIPAGQFLDLAVPSQTNGQLFTALNVIQREATATVVVIEK